MDQGGSDKPQKNKKKKQAQGQQSQADSGSGQPQQQQGGQKKQQQQGGQQKQSQGGQQQQPQQGGQQKQQQGDQKKQQQQQGGQQKQQQGDQKKQQQQGGQQKQQGGGQKKQPQQQGDQQKQQQHSGQQKQQQGDQQQQQGGQQKQQQHSGQQKQQQGDQQQQQGGQQKQQQGDQKKQQQQQGGQQKQQQGDQKKQQQQGGQQQQKQHENQQHQSQGKGQQQQKGNRREGDWNCSSCNNMNFAKKTNCNRCGHPKSQVTVSMDTADVSQSQFPPVQMPLQGEMQQQQQSQQVQMLHQGGMPLQPPFLQQQQQIPPAHLLHQGGMPQQQQPQQVQMLHQGGMPQQPQQQQVQMLHQGGMQQQQQSQQVQMLHQGGMQQQQVQVPHQGGMPQHQQPQQIRMPQQQIPPAQMPLQGGMPQQQQQQQAQMLHQGRMPQQQQPQQVQMLYQGGMQQQQQQPQQVQMLYQGGMQQQQQQPQQVQMLHQGGIPQQPQQQQVQMLHQGGMPQHQQPQQIRMPQQQIPPAQVPLQGGMPQQQQPQQVRMPQQQQQQPEKPKEGQPKTSKKDQSDWECPSCKNKNFAKKKVCNRCKVPKPDIIAPSVTTQQPITLASDQPGSSGSTTRSSPVTEIKEDLAKLSVSNKKNSPYPVLVDPNGSKWQGKRGKKFQVEVNFLPIILENLPDIAYHYDVTFDPDRPKKFYQSALNNFQAKHFSKTSFAFDGKKNVYTAHELPKPEMEDTIEVNDPIRGQKKNYKITLKYAATIDMRVLKIYNLPGFQNMDKPSRALQCLDIVLRSIFKINNAGVTAGRSIYYKPNNYMDLGLGMELWLGLFQSAILGRKQIYLNVDVSHKAFPSAMAVEKAAELYYDRNNRLNTDAFEKYLKTIDIEYHYNGISKTFGFNGLKDTARNQTFVQEDGTKMTVEQYFKTKRGCQLKRPDLPCLHVGSKVRNVYLPMEFCFIPAGQATNMKCPPECVAKMIRYSATSTEERKSKIVNLLRNIEYQKSNVICDFGLKINKNFENVEARVIDPPIIEYKNGARVQVRKGVWRNETFIEPDNKLIKWAILKCDERIHKNDIQNLKRELLNQASKHQICLDQNVIEESVDMGRPRPNELETKLDNLKKRGIQFVVVIIIDRNDCYAKVKQAAEIKVGILTQCIKTFTLSRKMDPSTVGNILLKVNAKLNGINHKLVEHAYNSNQVGTMFVGGDVTHPSPEQRDIPSVVGVAASYDVTGFKYNCSWRLQGPRVEMIKDFENIMVDHLNFYRQKNGQFPNRIFYYRDGVSDGQFQEVLDEELCALKKAGARLKCNPKITFIIVQKRHHTRFFPDKRFGDGKNNNVPAGTIVDKDIVHPHQYQFFLASHAAIQGVTKPTKYCVIYDENLLQADYMEHLTYSLCHLFTRCNRAVSYTAPTYYAHLVAARGKQYIIGRRVNIDDLDREYNQRKISNEIINNFPMFFV